MSVGRADSRAWEKTPMRWIVVGLLVVASTALSVTQAAAQAAPSNPCDDLTPRGGDPCQPIPATQPGLLQSLLAPDSCSDWAAQSALPSLNMAYAFQPDSGYVPYGWGPMTQPFGAGAYGPATLFSPPGLAPVYGPFGPGQTASVLAVQAFPNGVPRPTGVPAVDARNTLTALSLAGLQQAELGNLYGRYGLGASYQTANAVYVSGYSAQASAISTILRGMCHAIQAGALPVTALPPGMGR